jgi:hypothetical protein
MKNSVVVIDMPTNHWFYTDAYNEVLDSGTKILLSCSDEELLVRLEPCKEIAKLTDEAAEVISKANTIKILSEAGTNLTMSIEGRKCNPQAIFISETRRWDNLPSGKTEIAPIEDSANAIPMSGTGSAGMETIMANLLEPGDKAIICTNGIFGQRMRDVAARCGAEVISVKAPWGDVIQHEQVSQALKKVGKVKLIGIVHAET